MAVPAASSPVTGSAPAWHSPGAILRISAPYVLILQVFRKILITHAVHVRDSLTYQCVLIRVVEKIQRLTQSYASALRKAPDGTRVFHLQQDWISFHILTLRKKCSSLSRTFYIS